MNKSLRIILLDLETLPDLKAAMPFWTQLSNYPGLTLKASISSIICAGWKEINSKSVQCINAWDFKEWDKDINNDIRVIEAIREVLLTADVVVTWNGKGFDWKFLETRALMHGLKPLPKIHHVDGKQVAKSNLFLFNNRLQTAAKALTDTEKLENGGWELWEKVMAKDKKAMDLMSRYCKQDIRTLEAVFRVLLPYCKLPNANMFKKELVCPTCASQNIQRRGERVTLSSIHQRYQCQDCGSWSSAKPDKTLKAEK